MRNRSLIGIAAVVWLSGCARHLIVAPDALSPPLQRPAVARLRAGFGRVDLTPPPGAGLMGYGPEGARSRGYRMRLYARALLLEDAGGERIALVVTDLMSISALVQRKAAEVLTRDSIVGADRLIVSATHTHSAPGHFFAVPAYDEQSSSVAGFDPVWTDTLASRIARAVREAHGRLAPARAAWGRTLIWGRTRVRHEVAVARNPDRFQHPSAGRVPLPNDPRYRYIDPQLTMLRVDILRADALEPAGSFMIFPVHGTLNPGANQLMDGDLHTIVTRELEQRVGRRAQTPNEQPRTIHLFANGAEGDIIADFSTDSRCPPPAPRPAFVPTGPRRPPPPNRFAAQLKPPFPYCLQRARADAYAIARVIVDSAYALHTALGRALDHDSTGQLRIARVHDVMRAYGASPRLCPPHMGPAALAGVESGFIRLLNVAAFRSLLGADTVPTPPAPLPPPNTCRGAKPDIDWFERLVGGRNPFPREIQLTVLRIGDVVIGAIPAEAATNAGALLRRALAPDGASPRTLYEHHLILGLANGYMQYVTTPHEYGAQLYEGASTLNGVYAALHLAAKLRTMARQLPLPGRPSPAATVAPINGSALVRELIPRPSARRPADPLRRARSCWAGDTLVLEWNDHRPGDLDPAQGKLLQIDRREGANWIAETWDDDPFLEVWYIGKRSGRHNWQARYAPHSWAGTTYRVTLLSRGSMPDVTSELLRGRPQCRVPE